MSAPQPPPVSRPRLQPRAEVIRQFFPIIPGRSGVTERDIPRQIDQLAAALEKGDRQIRGALADQREKKFAEAKEVLTLNPNLTEQELVEALGGHRTVARQALTENEGRLAAQEFGFRLRRALQDDGTLQAGPEAVRDRLNEEMRAFFDDLPEDSIYRSGASDGLGDLASDLITASVRNEDANIRQSFENDLATEARQLLAFGDPAEATAQMRERLAMGEFAGLDPADQRAAVIQTYATYALENPFEGDEVLSALVDGDDPLIKDPQERAAVVRVRRTVIAQQERLADEIDERNDKIREERQATLLAEIAAQKLDTGSIDPGLVAELRSTAGDDVALEALASINRDFGAARDVAIDPVQRERLVLQAERGLRSPESFLADESIPTHLRVELARTARQGTPQSVLSTPEYKAAKERLKGFMQLDLVGNVTNPDDALRVAALESRAQAAFFKDRSLLEPASADRRVALFTGFVHELVKELPRTPGAASTRQFEESQQELSEALSAATPSREEIMERVKRDLREAREDRDPTALGESAGAINDYNGQDPLMTEFYLPEPLER